MPPVGAPLATDAGGGKDQRSGIGFEQQRQQCLSQHKGGVHVYLHHVLPYLRVLLAHRANVTEQSGIMQYAIQTREMRGNALCEPGGIRQTYR